MGKNKLTTSESIMEGMVEMVLRTLDRLPPEARERAVKKIRADQRQELAELSKLKVPDDAKTKEIFNFSVQLSKTLAEIK